MDIDNKKKSKASEPLPVASGKRRRREIVLTDQMDPVFLKTKEEVTESINKFFDDCDPALRNQGFGWGYTPSVAKDMHERVSAEKSLKMVEYYKDKPASLLESDKALCEGICPLHVFYIAAYEWGTRPDVCYGSYEQQVLFYVMKHNFQLQKKPMEKFVLRLLNLSYHIKHAGDIEKDGEDEKGNIKWKKAKPGDIKKIEPHQQAAMGIFFYPNLQFLFKRKDQGERYFLVCESIKYGVDSFCEVLQQLDERLRPSYRTEWSHQHAGQRALDHALEKCHNALKYYPHWYDFKFNEKPLSIFQEMAFNVSF